MIAKRISGATHNLGRPIGAPDSVRPLWVKLDHDAELGHVCESAWEPIVDPTLWMSIVDPTLWMSRERRDTTELLQPVYRAVVALLRAYDHAVEHLPKLTELRDG